MSTNGTNGTNGTNDADEQRQQAHLHHDLLRRAVEAAGLLPPMEWGDWTVCATPGCGQRTAAYHHMADGARIPICGTCLLQEMEAVEDVLERERYERHERDESS